MFVNNLILQIVHFAILHCYNGNAMLTRQMWYLWTPSQNIKQLPVIIRRYMTLSTITIFLLSYLTKKMGHDERISFSWRRTFKASFVHLSRGKRVRRAPGRVRLWLDEIWLDNWQLLNWMKGESFSRKVVFGEDLYLHYSLLCEK